MFKKLGILILALSMVAAMFVLASCSETEDAATSPDNTPDVISYDNDDEEPVESEEDETPAEAADSYDVLANYNADDWEVVNGGGTIVVSDVDGGISFVQNTTNSWGRVELMFENPVENATYINLTVNFTTAGEGGAFRILLLDENGRFDADPEMPQISPEANPQTPYSGDFSFEIPATNSIVHGFLIQLFDDANLEVTALTVVAAD